MSLLTQGFQSVSDLSLWYKLTNGDVLTMADIPQIIPLRWTYLRDNWNYLVTNIKSQTATYQFPDLLTSQITDFTSFVNMQRNSSVNPLANTSAVLPRFYAVFDSIPLVSIPLTQIESNLISSETQRVNSFTKTDFINLRSNLTALRDQMADQIGGTDPTYNEIYGRNPQPASLSPDIISIQEMNQIQQSIDAVNLILANNSSLTVNQVDPFALAKANANNPDFDMTTYLSGTLVRLNYGESLQSLANRYLGDPDKWIDIAIANGLKPPYIDEVGVQLPLISNGAGNQINIGPTDTNGNPTNTQVYLNQVVFLQSNSLPSPQQFTIISINVVPISGELVITLDTQTDLSIYTTADSAYMRVYAPNTTNSNYFILIPSTTPLPPDTVSTTPWFLATTPQDEQRAKIDLLLGSNNDLVFDATGDLSLSYGMANALQAVKLKMITEEGSLPLHPNFGLVNVMGTTNANAAQVQSQIVNSINAQIAADPRFDRIESLVVSPITTASSSGFLVQLVVRLAGSSTTVPITFQINQN